MLEEPVNNPDRRSTLGPESVRQELERLLASTPFATAARSRRFLSYVTEKTLAGERDAIKELIVGMEVFDRAGDFDPRTDTIVRVEAGKLRKRLREYYEGEGIASPLRIEIPVGTYVPSFEVRPAEVRVDEVRLDEPPAPPEAIAQARQWWKYAVLGLVAAVLLGGFFFWRVGALRAQPSIAVLPFLNLSSDPANEYFADGLTEDLTDALARLGGLRVASRTSAFTFKGKRPDIHEVGTKLNAAFVVEGSVRKEGQRIKISAQLVRAGDGYHVWSNSFERDIKDVFAVQQEIARSVASTLDQKLTGARTERLAPYTASVEAFDLYMRGRHAAVNPILSDIDAAERFLKQAIVADPRYPLPYISLAEIYLNADIFQLRPTPELVGLARGAISKALALDSKIAATHVVLGSLAGRHEYDWAAAERHFHDALELDANSASAHFGLALHVFAPQGRWREAETEHRQAMELDPASALGAISQPFLEQLQRHYDSAIAGFRAYSATHPLDTTPEWTASCLMGKGDYSGAIELLNGMLSKHANFPMLLASTGYAHGRAGHVAEARKKVEELTALSKSRFVSSSAFAFVYMGLNDRDRAFECLERARRDQESFLIFSRVGVQYDPIRSDPRFARLLAELRLDDQTVSKNEALSKSVYR